MVDGIPKKVIFNPKTLEAWFTLMAEAAKGTAEAQEAFKSLAEVSANPEELQHWQARFLPLTSAATNPEVLDDWLEAWWRMMGVVPRSRYLDLLERCETLRLRLEQAEETICNLRAQLGQSHEQETRRIVNLWGTMLQEGLKRQAEWMHAWGAVPPKEEEKDDPEGEQS